MSNFIKGLWGGVSYFSFFLGVPDLFALDVEAEGVSLVSAFFPDSCCSSSCMRSLSDRTGATLLLTPPLEKKEK